MAAPGSGAVPSNLPNAATVDDLRDFLRKRNIPNSKYKKSELKEIVKYAENFNLTPKPTEQEERLTVEQETARRLCVDSGLLTLPNPDDLINNWEKTSANFPDLTANVIDAYVTECAENLETTTGGKKAKLEGQSVEAAGHVREVEYNHISGNINYCFVRCKVVPQMAITKEPYKCWVILNKITGAIESSLCFCRAGLRGYCKHVVALLCHVLRCVQAGNNKACTAKPQLWHAPRKGQKIHKPEFAKNITIVGIHGDLDFESLDEKKSRQNRSVFDPRPPANRKAKPIAEMNLDRLEEVTNGNCGFLLYAKPRVRENTESDNESDQENTCNDCSSLSGPQLPITVEEARLLPSCSTVTFYNNMSTTQEQIDCLSNSTKEQCNSVLWHDQRKGRITASKAGECAAKVNEHLQVNRACSSTIASIMGYYPPAYSKALEWGRKREKAAQKIFVYKEKQNHQNLSVQPCGLFLSAEKPHIGASPDGIVHCSCCERACLEIKNPYTHRYKTVSDYAQQKDACLEAVPTLCLKRNHAYYAQVQVQMYVTGTPQIHFVLKTASKTESYYHELISFDSEYVHSLLAKLDAFHSQEIVPEQFSQRVKTTMIMKDVTAILKNIINIVVNDKSCSSTPAQDALILCPLCEANCIEEPISSQEQSIGCDGCDRWYHHVCVGICGTEAFVKNKQSKWYCPSCMF